jgi:hypothetical protein
MQDSTTKSAFLMNPINHLRAEINAISIKLKNIDSFERRRVIEEVDLDLKKYVVDLRKRRMELIERINTLDEDNKKASEKYAEQMEYSRVLMQTRQPSQPEQPANKRLPRGIGPTGFEPPSCGDG